MGKINKTFNHGEIYLREIEEQDLEPMRLLRNNPSTRSHLTHNIVIDPEAQRKWHKSLIGREDKKYFILYDDQHEFLGIIRFDEIDKGNRSIRIGCDIVPALRAKGYGSKALSLIKKYCFEQLKMNRLWLAVLDTNQIARGLYKKHGFKEEGCYRKAIFRNGQYIDYIIMSLLEEEYREK